MSLRANTYVALTGAAFIAVALIFAATVYAGREWVHSAERNVAMAVMRQTAREVTSETHFMDAVAHDWGSWDDAVRFIGGKNPTFIADNVPAAALKQLEGDAFIMLDIHGRPAMETVSSRLATDPLALAALHAATAPGSKLLATSASSPKKGVSGIIEAGNQAILVVARPIVSSSETGPVVGTTVFARVLDPALLKTIGSVVGVKLTARSPHDPTIPAAVRTALLEQAPGSPIVVAVKRPIDITAYLRLDGMDKHAALVLSSPIAPVNYETAMRTLAALIAVFLIGGLMWALVAFMVVDSTSLSRMTWLRDAMTRIAESGTLTTRIGVEDVAGDEVATVAREVNSMLDALSQSHSRMRESEEQHRVLVENMADAVFTLGHDRTFTFANAQAERLTGISAEKLLGLPYWTVLSSESLGSVHDRLENLPTGGDRPLPVVFIDAGGRTVPVELAISPVLDAEAQPIATTWIARDITERRQFEDQLMHLANHDHLTGLFNRRRFEEEVAQHLAETRRRGDAGALVWIDLDRFKEVNDTFGHRVGDELLARVATVLRERSREDQVLARLGGDEFAMLLPGADEAEAIAAAERVLCEFSATMVHGDNYAMRVSASAGVALYPQHATTLDELLLRADVAMYRAKESGRNRVCFFSPDEVWPEQLVARREWADRIETALAEDAFVPYAQPMLDLRTGRITAYELLVRLSNPEDGAVIEPAAFLSAAEDLGLITQIDRLMVCRAVELAAMPEVRASGVKLWVNLSAKTLADAAFLMFVRATFEEANIDPRQIGFELTETALVANMSRAHQLIGQLRDLGCAFALDDFGSGFSSITYLRHMPVDRLKIDGSLVREMLVNQQDQHLVRAIIDLARCLDIRVTAEYVENESTLLMLKAAGADFAQGYFIGAPLPARDVLLGPACNEVSA